MTVNLPATSATEAIRPAKAISETALFTHHIERIESSCRQIISLDMNAQHFLVAIIVVYSVTCVYSQEKPCPENEEWRKCAPLQFHLDCDDTCLGTKQFACLSEVCQQLFVKEMGDCRCKAGMVRPQVVGGACIPREQCPK